MSRSPLYATLAAMSFRNINHSGYNCLRRGRKSVVTAPHSALIFFGPSRFPQIPYVVGTRPSQPCNTLDERLL